MLSEQIVSFINNMRKESPKNVCVIEASSLATPEPRTYSPLFSNTRRGTTLAWAEAYNRNVTTVDAKGNVTPQAAQFILINLLYGQRYLASRISPHKSYSGHETRMPIIMDVTYHGITDSEALNY